MIADGFSELVDRVVFAQESWHTGLLTDDDYDDDALRFGAGFAFDGRSYGGGCRLLCSAGFVGGRTSSPISV